MVTMTRAEFSRHRGVSKAAVTQWASAGRLVLANDGKVDVAASEARLAATVNSRGGKRQRGVSGGAQAIEARRRESGPTPEFDFDGTLTEARTKQANTRARLDDLEYQERIGRLIERDRIERAIADGLAPILSQLDTLSTRVAPKLVGETDLRRIQDVIDDEVDVLRQDTADTLRAVLAAAGLTRQ